MTHAEYIPIAIAAESIRSFKYSAESDFQSGSLGSYECPPKFLSTHDSGNDSESNHLMAIGRVSFVLQHEESLVSGQFAVRKHHSSWHIIHITIVRGMRVRAGNPVPQTRSFWAGLSRRRTYGAPVLWNAVSISY